MGEKIDLTFPALKKLGELSVMSPVIVVDTREQDPLPFGRLGTVRGTLQAGDYSIQGLESEFAVERKSLADLTGCCKSSTKAAEDERARLKREFVRLRGFRFSRLLIVGTRAEIMRHEYRSEIKPQSVLASLDAWDAEWLPVVHVRTPLDGARVVETWAYWFARAYVKRCNALLRAGRANATGEGT